MKKYSLYFVVFVFLLILAVTSSSIIYFSLNRHREQLIKSAIEEKIHLASTINETINSPFWMIRVGHYPVVTKTFIREMSSPEEIVFCRIVTKNGGVFLSSFEEEGTTIKDPAISQALETKNPVIRDGIFGKKKIKEIIYPGYGDRVIWIGFSLEKTEKNIQGVMMREGLTIGGGLIFIILIVFLILRTIVDPLRKMTVACQEVRKGNLEVKVPVVSKTEIGELAETFNEMIKDLRESHTALEEAKTVLEVKVAARTRELKELAKGLEGQVKERTKELQERVEELERFKKLTEGRELKMVELKEEIVNLKKELEK